MLLKDPAEVAFRRPGSHTVANAFSAWMLSVQVLEILAQPIQFERVTCLRRATDLSARSVRAGPLRKGGRRYPGACPQTPGVGGLLDNLKCVRLNKPNLILGVTGVLPQPCRGIRWQHRICQKDESFQVGAPGRNRTSTPCGTRF